MIVGRIEGHTNIIGKSQGYKGLPIRVSNLDGSPMMESAWQPTPDELERLNKGASVILMMITNAHPPVRVEVGEPPNND